MLCSVLSCRVIFFCLVLYCSVASSCRHVVSCLGLVLVVDLVLKKGKNHRRHSEGKQAKQDWAQKKTSRSRQTKTIHKRRDKGQIQATHDKTKTRIRKKKNIQDKDKTKTTLSNFALAHFPISHLAKGPRHLSRLVLSCLVFSFFGLVFSCPLLSPHSWFLGTSARSSRVCSVRFECFLSCLFLILSCLVLSCLVLSCLVCFLSCLILSFPVLSCLASRIWSCLVSCFFWLVLPAFVHYL